MKKPTKAQRHAIYKKALKEFDQNPSGLCRVVGDLAQLQGFVRVYHVPDHWPEFSAQKPVRTSSIGWWWSFTAQGHAARRRALLKMIEMSAPKPRSK
jgi:hypothetical protein